MGAGDCSLLGLVLLLKKLFSSPVVTASIRIRSCLLIHVISSIIITFKGVTLKCISSEIPSIESISLESTSSVEISSIKLISVITGEVRRVSLSR